MKILVENGAYRMDNMGDVAMLQVCVRRIRDRWPECRIRVVTETPERLLSTCPDVEPIAPSRWHRTRVLPRRLRFRGSDRVERRAQLHFPSLAYAGKRRQLRHDHDGLAAMRHFFDAVRGADVVVCSGGGFLTDWHVEHGEKVLHTLGLAQSFHRPTAMFGAGLGPLSDTSVGRLARRVLSRLDVLAMREGQGNRAELARLGVRCRRICVTGDDAIEPAYHARPPALGRGIGVCLRLAAPAQAPRGRVGELGRSLLEVAATLDAPLLSVPVRNRLSPENDVEAVRSMFPPGSIDSEEAERVTVPSEVVRLIGRCRVVVTGAYHAGVFALSQGIPVVALSGSTYYERKFEGLLEQFGSGIEIVRFDEPELPFRLRRAVEAAWRAAPHLGDGLRLAAERQLTAGRGAYERFFEIVERRGAPFARSARR